uniref:Uncharacterized protein n=1 Tax=Rhizophora mucronata TaxID=61149 RepID=A0A2P2QVW8_RHIMU
MFGCKPHLDWLQKIPTSQL